MPWIPDVNPNELIESQWGNDIRDHVVARLASAAERDAAIAAPHPGQTIWVDDRATLQTWTGARWIDLPGIQATNGVPYQVRVRTSIQLLTTDASFGVANVGWSPPLGTTIVGSQSMGLTDDQTAMFAVPIWNQFTPGATATQYRFSNAAGNWFTNATVRLSLILIDSYT